MESFRALTWYKLSIILALLLKTGQLIGKPALTIIKHGVLCPTFLYTAQFNRSCLVSDHALTVNVTVTIFVLNSSHVLYLASYLFE